MRRVMIVGGPGSGKTTLARWLGARTGLPVHHMDLIHWRENWVERPLNQKISLARAVEDSDAWIFEGGLSSTYETRVARADTVIWLDLPVGLRLWRVTRRRLRHWGEARPDMPAGCVEGFNAEFLPFYRFIWTSRHRSREKIADALAKAPGDQTLLHLKNRAAVRAFQQRFDAS